VRAALVAALTGLMIVGCTTSHESSPSSKTRPTTTLFPVALVIDDGTPSAVKGQDYRETIQVPTQRDGWGLAFGGRRGDTLVLAQTDESADGSGEKKDPRGEHMVLFDMTQHTFVDLPYHGTVGAPSYLAATAVAGRRVLWTERSETDLYHFTWEMYSYDLDSGEERKIASHAMFGIEHPPPTTFDGVWPVVLGDWVYFAAVDKMGKEPKDAHGSVYRVPLDGDADPERIVPGAYDVRRFGDHLMVQIKGDVLQWDPAKGESGEIKGTRQSSSCGFRTNQETTILCPRKGDASVLEVTSPEYGSFTVDIGDRSGPGYLNVTRRWASFSADEEGYVLDLKRGRLMKLDGAQDAGWTDFEDGELMYQNFALGDDPMVYEQKTMPLIELLPASDRSDSASG